MKKYYSGKRLENGQIEVVKFNEEMLDPRFDLANHSPTGFNWGYEGSGAAQLALAILADYFEDDSQALSKYQDFKRSVIANFTEDTWELSDLGMQIALNVMQSHQTIQKFDLAFSKS